MLRFLPHAKGLLMTSPTLRFVFAVVAAGTLIAAPVRAQINVAWNNCITETNASDNIAYACDGSRNGLPFRCVVSVIPPVSVPAFVGAQVVIDIYGGTGPSTHPLGPLPDFWRLGSGECRDGFLLMPVSTFGTGGSSCLNPWTGANTGGGYQYTSSSDQARLVLVFARDTQTALTGGQQYVAVVFGLDTWKDTDTGYGECPGCCSSMALVANNVTLYQLTPGNDVTLFTQADRNWVTWQSTDGNHQPGCAPTPVRRGTWGSIKATYR
jgi:hypothetical protein